MVQLVSVLATRPVDAGSIPAASQIFASLLTNTFILITLAAWLEVRVLSTGKFVSWEIQSEWDMPFAFSESGERERIGIGLQLEDSRPRFNSHCQENF